MKKEYQSFYHEISRQLDASKIFTEKIHRIAYGTEASFYQLIPEIVLKPSKEEEVKKIILLAKKHGLSYTFKAAGTSLSGQSVTDSILIVAREGFEKVEISDDRSSIRLGVGNIAGSVNARLIPFGKKLGPDPATVNSAMIGGIVNNNSSGMCCGTDQNTYKTLVSMRLILSDGTLLDTSDEKSVSSFKQSHREFLKKIEDLSKKTKANKILFERIRNKYKIKNTTGYSLNALVDFEDPIEILQRLIIGSEGTLGFVSEVVYKTVDEHNNKASSLVLFKDVSVACEAVMRLKEENDKLKEKGDNLVSAAEIMDRQSLRSIEDKKGVPPYLKDLGEPVAALLLDLRGVSESALDEKIKSVSVLLKQYELERDLEFTKDAQEINVLWATRRGLLPSVGSIRAQGTSVIIEDVAFPFGKLKEGIIDLRELLDRYGYDKDGIIFGHALDSNVHFVLCQSFSSEKEIARYDHFIQELVKLMTEKYEGSLKAEHGTGRNMAPFVLKEWGEQAYAVMKEIKQIFDPDNLINPGVILNDDEKQHLKNLKAAPRVNDMIDRCMECGFCEHVCPSRDLTLTPRGRIIIARQMQTFQNEGDSNALFEMKKAYLYQGLDTCAKCSLCEIECPVDINTGAFIKTLEEERNSFVQGLAASVAGSNFKLLSTVVEQGLKGFQALNKKRLKEKDEVFSKADSRDSYFSIPHWDPFFPSPLKPNFSRFSRSHSPARQGEKVVYMPSCMSRNLGTSQRHKDHRPLFKVITEFLTKQGFQVILPKDSLDLCCGLAFSSKGFKEEADKKQAEMIGALLEETEGGKYPILMDTGSCSERMRDEFLKKGLKVYDSVNFISEKILPQLTVKKKKKKIALHVACAVKKMGAGQNMIKIAKTCAEEVVLPIGVECCGAAGDKWLRFPELTRKSLRKLKEQVKDCERGYSNNVGCEGNLSRNSGIEYYSLWHLLEEVV